MPHFLGPNLKQFYITISHKMMILLKLFTIKLENTGGKIKTTTTTTTTFLENLIFSYAWYNVYEITLYLEISKCKCFNSL